MITHIIMYYVLSELQDICQQAEVCVCPFGKLMKVLKGQDSRSQPMMNKIVWC